MPVGWEKWVNHIFMSVLMIWLFQINYLHIPQNSILGQQQMFLSIVFLKEYFKICAVVWSHMVKIRRQKEVSSLELLPCSQEFSNLQEFSCLLIVSIVNFRKYICNCISKIPKYMSIFQSLKEMCSSQTPEKESSTLLILIFSSYNYIGESRLPQQTCKCVHNSQLHEFLNCFPSIY